MKGNNPILKGFHPDPCIIRVRDDYYMATSTFQWFPGVELYHSKDLVNWELLPSPLSRTTQLDLMGVPNSCGVWAPCLSYCDGTFYLIYTVVRDFQRKFIDLKNYLVTTTDICGEWSEPIYLNASGFDPSLFHDDDGKKYLVNMLMDFRDGNTLFGGILLQEYSEAEKKLVGKPTNIYKGTSVGITESPHLYKKDGYYYLMVAEGGTLYDHGTQLARSKKIAGPYESDPQPLLTTRHAPDHPIQRTGHSSLVDTPDGRYYVSFLCGRPLLDEKTKRKHCILGRESCLTEVIWKDGWLRLKDGGVIPPLSYESSLPEHTFPKDSDLIVFNQKTLPPQFKTLRIPFEKIGSLTERAGFLRLFGHEAITSFFDLSLVARRLDCFHVQATTKLFFSPESIQQSAGITVYYDSFNFFYLYVTADDENNTELRILVSDNLKFYNPIDHFAVRINDPSPIWLRVNIDKLTLEFSYSLDGKYFENIGGKLNCANISDEAYSDIGFQGHTGTFVGVTCQDLSGNNIHADFESFSYIRK